MNALQVMDRYRKEVIQNKTTFHLQVQIACQRFWHNSMFGNSPPPKKKNQKTKN